MFLSVNSTGILFRVYKTKSRSVQSFSIPLIVEAGNLVNQFIMESSIKSPLWMDRQLFTDVVQHHLSDVSAKVLDFKVKPALAEHFASAMFRVEMNFSTTSRPENFLSVVIKIPPTHGTQVDFIESSPLFEIEQDMYKSPLNDIKLLLESVGDFSQIHPKLIYQAIKPHRVIVLEDLSLSGYTRVLQPLEDFEESRMVFERLSKFHASSFFLINERKVDFSRFSNYSVFHIEDPILREKWLIESIETFTEVLESWGGHDEYVGKLKVFRENFLEIGKRLYEQDPAGYNVLNHGDFHIKNLLFKKAGGKIEDFYFLDYQVSVLASPCVDLFYALYNHISDENRWSRRNEIIHVYHVEFTNTLKRLGYIGKIPSLLDLQMSLVKHGQMEVVKCICFKMFFWTDAADAQIDEVLGSSDSKSIKARIYNDPRFRSFIKVELPRLLQMGFL